MGSGASVKPKGFSKTTIYSARLSSRSPGYFSLDSAMLKSSVLESTGIGWVSSQHTRWTDCSHHILYLFPTTATVVDAAGVLGQRGVLTCGKAFLPVTVRCPAELGAKRPGLNSISQVQSDRLDWKATPVHPLQHRPRSEI